MGVVWPESHPACTLHDQDVCLLSVQTEADIAGILALRQPC